MSEAEIAREDALIQSYQDMFPQAKQIELDDVRRMFPSEPPPPPLPAPIPKPCYWCGEPATRMRGDIPTCGKHFK